MHCIKQGLNPNRNNILLSVIHCHLRVCTEYSNAGYMQTPIVSKPHRLFFTQLRSLSKYEQDETQHAASKH